jgi:tetratricopeptide (TPR) repeat protein
VQFALGKIYYTEKGLYYEAVSAYKKAIDLDQYFLEARMGLGEIYEEKGLYKDAIVEYKKVIEVDSKHTSAHYNLAMAYEKTDPAKRSPSGTATSGSRPPSPPRRSGWTSPGSTSRSSATSTRSRLRPGRLTVAADGQAAVGSLLPRSRRAIRPP